HTATEFSATIEQPGLTGTIKVGQSSAEMSFGGAKVRIASGDVFIKAGGKEYSFADVIERINILSNSHDINPL
ncbi:hypothetical protein WCE10_21835, partial [Cronobacter muytjensii]|uniref:hypothetical protein n=1 Tax=Cronobacter muytjensii TaxID=413501 RepID=UPI0034D7954A